MTPTNIIIQCPVCEWQPDGEAHWGCSCGFAWNTFDTKAKCPNCHKQWEDTQCPGCNKKSPHKDWYVDLSMPVENNDSPETLELKRKKRLLENGLISLGIKNNSVSYLPYLDHSTVDFQKPYNVGCRLLILYAVAYSVHHLGERPKIINWLKREHIWEKVSEKEKEFFGAANPAKKTLGELSWGIECALTLGWVLNLFDNLHEINRDETEEEMDIFFSKIPPIGGETKGFLDSVSYRSLEEIYLETLVNEMATGYFRDLFAYGKEDGTQINRMVNFQRHLTLNWVRKFSEIEDWDNTDTST